MVIASWIILLGEWRVLKTMYLPSGLALFLLIAAPWHIMVGRTNPEFFYFYFYQEHFLRYLTKMHSRYQPAWFFIPIVLLGLFPWSAFLVQAVKHSLPASWKDRHEHRESLFLILWAGLVFLFFSASSSKLVPYILPVFPPLALLIGRYLSAAWESRDFPGIRTGFAVYLATALLLAGAFLASPFAAPPELTAALGPFVYAIAFTLAVGAAIAWALAHYRGFQQALVAVVAASAIFLIVVNAAAPRVDFKSAKGLAQKLKPLLKPGDEVASFEEYYQDLPVYLERRITVVDWGGELDFGARVEDTHQWITDGATFWQRWQGPATIYMLTSLDTYNALLRSDKHLPLYPVARNRRNILLVNREVLQ
jgi:4-amino-4-deoxy-L-arabinose transferase-like glycosyltransferase